MRKQQNQTQTDESWKEIAFKAESQMKLNERTDESEEKDVESSTDKPKRRQNKADTLKTLR